MAKVKHSNGNSDKDSKAKKDKSPGTPYRDEWSHEKRGTVDPEKVLATCTPVKLDPELAIEAAFSAIDMNPVNAPFGVDNPKHISVLTQKYWGSRATDLTFGFMEQVSTAFRDKVLAFSNMWGEFAKVKFRWTQTSPMIRISTGPGGYYSYLGPDCLQIPKNQQTMNLEGFRVQTPDSEWNRVVKHEFGHSLGCPHEQQREAILALLDETKTIAYFRQTQGWSEQEVREQVLMPLDKRSLMQGSSPDVDVTSIMCYQFPGSITKNGQPIPGGLDFSSVDKQYFAKIYPKDDVVIPPTPPAGGLAPLLFAYDKNNQKVGEYRLVTTPGGSIVVLEDSL
jgi:hypothetical protein